MHLPEPDLDWYLDHVVVPSGPQQRTVGPILAWEGAWQAEVNALASRDAAPALRRALDVAVRQGFVLTRAQGRACGLTDAALRSLVRRGTWCACSYGVLGVVTVSDLDTADATSRAGTDRRRHAVVAAAAALRHPGHVISGVSAAVLHGLPLLRVPVTPELTAADPATPGRRRRSMCARPRWSPRTSQTGSGHP